MPSSAVLSELLGATGQLLAALVLVILFWLCHRFKVSHQNRAHTPFSKWIGFVRPTGRMRERLILIGGIVLLNLVLMALAHLLEWNKALGELVAMGPVASLTTIDPWWAAMIAALSYAFLRTAGSEELLFRGLLYKRLIPLIGQKKANLIQALLFTLLHNWIIHRALPDAPLWVHADLFIRIFILSWVVGWYMEVRDNGSLLMPWICHGIANTLTFLGLYLA